VLSDKQQHPLSKITKQKEKKKKEKQKRTQRNKTKTELTIRKSPSAFCNNIPEKITTKLVPSPT
jgi:hypothetical protein